VPRGCGECPEVTRFSRHDRETGFDIDESQARDRGVTYHGRVLEYLDSAIARREKQLVPTVRKFNLIRL